MSNHLIPTQSRRPALRAEDRAAKRAAVAERRRLAAELSTYRSEADLNDLNALLDNYPDHQVAELRELLNRGIAA